MNEWESLKHTLAASVRRNGEKPLTNAYLLNIMQMADRVRSSHNERVEAALDEAMDEERKWGA